MLISVNTEVKSVSESITLAQLLIQEEKIGSFAIAVNSEFVAKARYETTRLTEGDKIDILSPIAGG